MAHTTWILVLCLASLQASQLSWAAVGATAAGLTSRHLLAAQASFSPSVPEAAVLQRYPYMVNIRSDGSCSGVLLDPMTLLTAAHCVKDDDEDESELLNDRWQRKTFNIIVRSGTRNAVYTTGSWSIRHPRFADPSNWEYVDFDLAIIHLDACVESSSYARLPCSRSQIAPMCQQRSAAWSYGYGRIEGNIRATELRRAGPFNTGCKCTSRDQRPSSAAEAYFCLYEQKLDPRGPVEICRGDSGGPVMLEQRQGAPVVVGLNSWGDGNSCGTIRRKNAGYATDLTHPDISRWLCWFVENPARRRYVQDTCRRGGFNRFRRAPPVFRPSG